MDAVFILLGLIITISICFINHRAINQANNSFNLPTGPTTIPLLGNILQMAVNPHLKFSEWAHKYGALYRIYLGPKPAIVISDAAIMKEFLSITATTGRYLMESVAPLSRGPYGIMHTSGPAWVEQRQFAVRTLVQSGFGKTSFEPKILAETQHLVDNINKQTTNNTNVDNGVEVHALVRCLLTNTMMRLVMDDESLRVSDKFAKIEDQFMRAVQRTVSTGLGFFPWLKYIAPELSGYLQLDKASLELHQFWIDHISRHKQGYVPDSPRDFIDAYFDKMRTPDTSSSFYGELGQKNMVASVVELFAAATETTAGTLVWLLYHVAFRLDIQLKIQQELNEVLGNSETSLSFKGKLPYTEAVILETMRMCPLVPMGVFHELLDDVKYLGFNLTKGLLIIANIWHCHHDTNVWGDPEMFRPERFLEAGGDRLKDKLTSFQLGRRSCLGEPLAKDILFINVTKILKEFEVKPVEGISKKKFILTLIWEWVTCRSQESF